MYVIALNALTYIYRMSVRQFSRYALKNLGKVEFSSNKLEYANIGSHSQKQDCAGIVSIRTAFRGDGSGVL